MREARKKINKLAYSVEEIAEMTSLSKSFVRKEIDAGNLTARRFGRRIVVYIADFETYIKDAKTKEVEATI